MATPQLTPQQRAFLVSEYHRTQRVADVLRRFHQAYLNVRQPSCGAVHKNVRKYQATGTSRNLKSERERGREGERERERERERGGGREGVRERGREGGREGGKERERERERKKKNLVTCIAVTRITICPSIWVGSNEVVTFITLN